MTFEEKQEKIKQNRSNAINNKLSLIQAENDAIDENNFNMSYLFGDGSYSGVSDFIKLYYQELEIENNTTFSYPSLSNYTESYWNTIFNNALNYSLSPALYINDEAHNYGQDIQSSGVTSWFNTNGRTAGTAGLLPIIQNVIDKIGSDATTLGTITSGYVYNSSADAISAGKTRAQQIDFAGTALKGKRSTDIIDPINDPNNEITATGDGGSPENYSYSVGDGAVENSDYYSNPEKSDLLNSIVNLIDNIDNNSSYQNKLTSIYNELDKLLNVSNPNHNSKIYQIKLQDDITDDRNNITTLKITLNNYVGDNSDILSDNTLYGFYNWFNSAIGDESNFNTNLDNLITLCNNITTTINNRASIVPGLVGNNENDKFKKHRYFWSKSIIKKPDGSLTTKKSVENGSMAKNNVNKQITAADEELVTLLGTSHLDEWIPTNSLYATYYDPKINKETGEIIEDRVYLIYSGQKHIQGYKIYRKLVSDVIINNDNWVSGEIDDFTDIGENGDVKIQYIDNTISRGELYVYRVFGYDNINDSYHTSSKQSKIYDDINIVSVNGITNNNNFSKINLSEHKFKKGSYCALINNTQGTNGFYIIIDADEDSITISPQVNETDNINVYYTTAITYTNIL